jgi:hypothetical protein
MHLEEQHIYLRVVYVNICCGDVTNADVDLYVVGYPRMMVISQEHGGLRSTQHMRRVSVSDKCFVKSA